MRSWILAFVLSLFLGGCLVGPNYRPPEIPVCDHWSGAETAAHLCLSCAAPPTAWWQLFGDPLLDKYIVMAALHNKDILAAEANICQAKAMRQVAGAPLYPHVNADLIALRTYFSKNGPFLSSMPAAAAATGVSPQRPRHAETIYNPLFDAYWEIDLFGKTRRSIEAANANVGSAIEQRNDLLITILSEVAMNYMQLRSSQTRGKLIEENIGLLERDVAIVTKQFAAGYRNQLDLQRIEAELAQAEAALPDVLAQIYQNIYALSALVGCLPEALLEELLPIRPLPQLPQIVTLGLRSDLLRRRPDVRQAERQLAAATANIGVAVASFFPSFILFGDVGLQSLRLSNLFQARSLSWALLGDLHIPLFEGGKLIGNLRANEAQAAAAAFTFQKAVLIALEEAESGLVAYTEEVRAMQELKDAVTRYEKLVGLTQERFTKGLVSVTDLLDVEREWNATEQDLLTSETAALLDLIRLYKALGGGWEPVCY